MIERGLRVGAPAGLALFAVFGVVQSRQPTLVAICLGVGVVTAGAVIAWRRPTGWPLVAALLLPAAGLTLLNHQNGANVGWFGLCLIAGWAAIGAGIGPAVTACSGLVTGFVVQWILSPEQPWGAWIAGTLFVAIGSAFTRRQWELLDQLRAAQAELADRARAEERNRLAAEMHDVIGHALTISLLHVSSARLALEEDPAEARDSLSEAERLARQSLTEVRATVGLMRAAETDEAPMPSARDVSELVASFRRAGTHVEFEVSGDVEELGAARGLAVYRIVQESLTNASRHGNGTPVTVRLGIQPGQTSVSITNGTAFERGAQNGVGHRSHTDGAGLTGMRERAEATGGSLAAGPCPGGWRVKAVLPS